MIIQHNMAAQNAMIQFGVANDNLKKATERLSSGYRVNRAADDAAALAISEKKRAQIRGLIRAARNAQDGISFVQTGDGAMNQIGAMLHRMRELAVQSLNDAVYEPEDQAAMQMEFDQLQSEIDRVNDQTEFNKKMVFEHYADDYSMLTGNRVWSQNQLHTIDSTNSSLEIRYIVVDEDGSETEKEMTLSIPAGTYTTQELMDEMDDVVTALGDGADGLYLEYTDGHKCNMVLQNGKEIKNVSGGLSYLFYDSYGGSKSGALIGTTVFFPGDPLMVKNGENDELHFRIEYFDGTMRQVDIDVAEDGYSRSDMIKYLNEYRFADGKTLIDYGIKASEYGAASIQIGGEDGIITGLKGNMFAIDDKHYDSVFYDNTKYGAAKETPAVFTGGDVLNASDVNFAKFDIDGTNNTLRLRVDGGTYETIQLDEGSYSITQMITELQGKLDAKGLGIKVTQHMVTGVQTPNGNTNYRFYGITLTTTTAGKEKKIEFDVPGSSAYDTLFVKRRYTDPGKVPQVIPGLWSSPYGTPYLLGGREFDATEDFPLTLDASNNSFYLEVTEQGQPSQQKKITMAEKKYQSLDEVIQEINDRIADEPAYAEKIQAAKNGNKVYLTTKAGNDTVTKINVSGSDNDGYNVLFVGEKITYPKSTNITLLPINPDASGQITFTDQNNKLNVEVGSEKRTVTVAPGTYTPEKLVELLNESQLKGKTTNSYPKYTASASSGTTVTRWTSQESGGQIPYTNTGAAGTGGKVDGSTQVKDGTVAWHQLGGTLGAYTKIDDTNHDFSIKINTKTYTVTLTNSTGNGYTQSDLAKEIKDRLDEVTSEANRVNVSVSGGHLRFETVAVGEGKSVTTAGCDSSFLSSVNTQKTKGYTTTSALPANTYPFTLTSSTNQFTIKIDGKAETVILTEKTYNNLGDIQQELNTKLSGKGVTVSQYYTGYGYGLRFERTTAGSGSVSLDINNSGTAGAVFFKSPASATLSQNITIPKATDASTPGTAKFSVTLGGKTYTTTLKNTDTSNTKAYTASQLQTELSKAVWQDGTGTAKTPADLGFSVSTSGSSVCFTTTARGSGQYISAQAEVGPVASSTPTVTASLIKNPDGTISIGLRSTTSFSAIPYNKIAVLQAKGNEPQRANPIYYTRTYTTRKCKLTTGRPDAMPDTVTISDDNNTLRFTYQYHGGTTKNVDITLDNGTYTRAKLQEMLQKKLDDSLEEDPLHKGEGLTVVVGDQITLESKREGTYNIQVNSMGGGFYEKIMKGTMTRTTNEKTEYTQGKLVVDDVYIVGRKDIRNKSTTIQENENDELNVDVTINGKVTTLNMTLDPGTYDSTALVQQIQRKLAEQLREKGLPEDMVLAGVGVYDSGAEGADDKNALFFYLNSKADLEPGNYGIDGLSGKALFSIFYKTDGDPIPAYVTGTKDISGGVEVEEGENEFSVDVDGTTYTYEIPAGSYDTAEELVDALNTVITDAADDSFLKASLSGNMLKISYTKLGEHQINNIQGSAKVALFYQTTGRFDQKKNEWLQIGANDGQGIKLERYSMSTLAMGINSLTISKHKYADKALVRIDDALKHLSSVRSKYGAMQNRLEYAVKADTIAAENTQSSESRDRDTDMASEMVEYAKSQILQQMGVSILGQANQNTQSVLALLS